MEKQTNFSIKPFRFLIFSVTLSSSLIFLSVFFFWVIGTSPPFSQPTLLPFHDTLPTSPPKPAPNGFNRKVKDSVLLSDSNFLDRSQRAQQLADVSTPDGVSREGNQSKAAAFEVKFGETLHGDSILTSRNLSAPAFPGVPPVTSFGAAKNSQNSVDFSVSDSVINASGAGRIDEEKSKGSSCDFTKGKWVFEESYPLYTNSTCPFIDEGFSCESNGRLDKDYMKWRWQPKDCHLPRFNAGELLELIRGKRLVFVGDSLNRNQWESMLCLLIGPVKDPAKVYETHGRRITKSRGDYIFKFVDYHCTVEYYMTHFLVHESKARIGKKRQQTLRIDTIDKRSSRWRGADILVFNTAHWWSHHKTKAGINYYQEGDQVYPRLDVATAFRRAMLTWGAWIDKNINTRKTQVFFRSYAPSHFSGGQWDSGGHCKEATQPSYMASSVSYEKNVVVEDVLKKMKTPVTLLNITEMSNYRIDGHPSVYGRKTPGVEDCSHWCLPGVPDSWNEMLYFHLKVGGRYSRPLWN